MAPSRKTRFLTNNISSLGMRAPSASNDLMELCNSATNSSGVKVVGSTGGRSSPSWAITASMSVCSGRAPRSRNAPDLGRDVAVGCADDEGEQRKAPRFAEPGGDAKVEEGYLARRGDQEVPAVEVTMEDPIDHRPFEKADHPGAHHGFGVDAGGVHSHYVGEIEAVHPFHDQHATGHECGMWTRDHVVALIELGVGLGHVEHVLCFESKVELFDNGLGEELDEGRRIGQGGDGQTADEVRG